jgi:hypothetical protein
LKSYLAGVLLCAALSPSIYAVAATRAAHPPAPAPQPELLNAPMSTPEPKKDDTTSARSTTPDGSVPPTTMSTAASPATTSTAPAVALPPAPPPKAQSGAAFSPSVSAGADRTLSPTLTDIVIALFALVVALFAWRLSSAASRLAATAHTQQDIHRRSVEASERAAEAAKRSAEAAEKSATVMQEQSARQLRPYVTVKEFLQGPVKDEKQFLHGWVFQVVWQNTGATPTRGFRYWAALRQFDHEIPADFDFAAPMLADFAGGELGSNATVTSGTLFVSQQDVLQIQSGARKAVLYGKAEYHDVVGQDMKRETRFCVEVMLVSDPAGVNATPFSFSYFPRHNAVS